VAVEVGTAYLTIIPSARGFAAKLQSELSGELKKALQTVPEEGEKAGRSFGSRLKGGVRSGLSGLGGILKTGLVTATAGLAVGLAAITGFGLKSAATLEQTQISFNSLTGSVKAGQAQFKALQKFAAATPFEFTDLTTSAGRFDAMAKSIGQTQAQLVPFLTTIGNVVSVTGGGAQNLDSVSLALSQITSRGKLTLDNINQLSNALPGFSGVAALAAVRGETQAKVMDEISAGTINASDGVNQLLKGMQQFPGAAGAMEKQSQTLLGVFSTFKDTVGQALVGAFAPIIPSIKDTLTTITPIVGQALTTLGPAIGSVLTGILPLLGQLVGGLAPILAPILTALGSALTALGPAIGPLANALTSIAVALAPILPLAAQFIGLLVTALSPILQSLTPLISGIVTGLSGLFGPLMPVILQLSSVLTGVLAPVFQVIGQSLAQQGPVIGQVLGALGSALSPLLQVLAPLLKVILDALSPLFPVFVTLAKPIVDIVVALTPLIQLLASLLTIAVDIVAPIIALAAQLLALLASKAIAPLIELLAKALTAILTPVTKLLGPLDKFGKWITKINWATVGKAIGSFFSSIGKDIWNGITDAFNAVGDFFHGLGASIEKGVTSAKDAVVNFVVGIAKDIFNFGAMLGRGVGTAIRKVVTIVSTGVANVITFVAGLPGKAVAALASLASKLGGVISSAWTWVKTKFTTGVNNAVAIAKGLPDKVISGVSTLVAKLTGFASGILDKLVGIGGSIIDGIISGVTNSGSKLLDALVDVAKNAWEGVKNFLGIGSPSKLYAEVGVDTVDGYTVGVNRASGDARRALLNAVSPPAAVLAQMANAQETDALLASGVGSTSNSWTINAAGTTIGPFELAAISAKHDAFVRTERSR
jgi:tape measure domain-containing protein